MQKPNITMKIIKLDRKKNSIQNKDKFKKYEVIESFEGIYKRNSRIIFFILLLFISIAYLYS